MDKKCMSFVNKSKCPDSPFASLSNRKTRLVPLLVHFYKIKYIYSLARNEDSFSQSKVWRSRANNQSLHNTSLM